MATSDRAVDSGDGSDDDRDAIALLDEVWDNLEDDKNNSVAAVPAAINAVDLLSSRQNQCFVVDS